MTNNITIPKELIEKINACKFTTSYNQYDKILFVFENDELIHTIKCCALSSPKQNLNGTATEYHYFYISKSFKETLLYDLLVHFGAISGDICYVHRGVYVINKKENIRGYEIHHLDFETNPNASTNNDIKNLVKLTPEEHKELHNKSALKQAEWVEFITLNDDIKPKQTRTPRVTESLKRKIYTMYHKKKMSYNQISKKLHCSKTTISKILKNYEYKPKKMNPVKACVEKVVTLLSVPFKNMDIAYKCLKANIIGIYKQIKILCKKSRKLNLSVCRYIHRTCNSSLMCFKFLYCHNVSVQRVYLLVKAIYSK